MGTIAAWLEEFRQAWEHRWESIASALAGVTEAEASHQAPCYRGEEPEEGWPLPGTIRWQVAHLAHCKRYYAECIRRRGGPMPESRPRARTASFSEDLAELRAAHAAECDAIAACADADLGGPIANGMTLGEFLAMALRHDIWHAGQIAVARRLWRTRGSPGA